MSTTSPLDRPAADVADDDGTGQRPSELRLARLHLRTGAYGLARAELETLAGAGALDDEALLDLAEVRWRTDDLTGAGEAAAAYIAGGHIALIALVVAAEATAALGRPGEARRLAGRALELVDGAIDPIFAGMPRSDVWPARRVERVVLAGTAAPAGPAPAGPAPGATVPTPDAVVAASGGPGMAGTMAVAAVGPTMAASGPGDPPAAPAPGAAAAIASASALASAHAPSPPPPAVPAAAVAVPMSMTTDLGREGGEPMPDPQGELDARAVRPGRRRSVGRRDPAVDRAPSGAVAGAGRPGPGRRRARPAVRPRPRRRASARRTQIAGTPGVRLGGCPAAGHARRRNGLVERARRRGRRASRLSRMPEPGPGRRGYPYPASTPPHRTLNP